MAKEFDINVHKSLKARKRWGILMKLSFIAFILVLCVCSVMLYYGFNHKWDPTDPSKPLPTPTPVTWWQWLLLIVGSIMAVGAMVGYIFFVCYESKRFYASQEKYWATKEFAAQKAEALKADLLTFKKSQLKWYKRMGYITGQEMRLTLEQQKQAKDKSKNKDKK